LNGEVFKEISLKQIKGIYNCELLAIGDEKYFFINDYVDYNLFTKNFQIKPVTISLEIIDPSTLTNMAFYSPKINYIFIKLGDSGSILRKLSYFNFDNIGDYLVLGYTSNYFFNIINLNNLKPIKVENPNYQRIPIKDPIYQDKLPPMKIDGKKINIELPQKKYFDDIQKILCNEDSIYIFTSNVNNHNGVLIDKYSIKGKKMYSFYLRFPNILDVKKLNQVPVGISNNNLYLIATDDNGDYHISKYKFE
jgi:hypothetical protein